MTGRQEKIKIKVDGEEIEALPKTSILEAVRQHGGESVPPAMCYYGKLKDSGGRCRTCLVEVSRITETDDRSMPKLVASCKTEALYGMDVQILTSE